MNVLARIELDSYRVQVMGGKPLTIEQQRKLLAHVERLQRQDDDNLNRLIRAREKFDALAAMEHDGSKLGKELLTGLMELGTTLSAAA